MRNKSSTEILLRLVLIRIGLSYLLFLGSALLFFLVLKVDEALDSLLYFILIGSGTIWFPIALMIAATTIALHFISMRIRWERILFAVASTLLMAILAGIVLTASEIQWQSEIYSCLIWLLSMTKYTTSYLEIRQKHTPSSN